MAFSYDLDPQTQPWWHWPLTCLIITLTYDLDLWPQTSFSDSGLKKKHNFREWPWTLILTFNPILIGVKVNLYAKNPGRRSNGVALRVYRQTMRYIGPIMLPLLLTWKVNTAVVRSPHYHVTSQRRPWHLVVVSKSKINFLLDNLINTPGLSRWCGRRSLNPQSLPTKLRLFPHLESSLLPKICWDPYLQMAFFTLKFGGKWWSNGQVGVNGRQSMTTLFSREFTP